MLRFRGQTQLFKSTPSEFQMAIEEALLAENGVLDTSFGTSQTSNSEAYAREIQEVTALDRDLEYYSQNQVNLFESIFFLFTIILYLSSRRMYWPHSHL